MSSTSAAPREPIASTTQSLAGISGTRVVLAIAAIKVLFQLATASRYGFFIDEFYYYACSEHLHWGYVDHPPLVAGLMWIATHVFGTSLLGIRVTPALLGGLLVWMVGATTRELGGCRFAQALAACCVLAAPIYMLNFHYFSMNAVEPVIWTACAYCAIRAIKGDPRFWIGFGVLCGIGMENKYSIVFFVTGVFLGLLLTSARKAFVSIYFWLGMLLALLIFLPNLLWLMHNNYPFLQWRAVMAERGELLNVPVGTFLFHQVLWTGATCVVWVAGVIFFLFDKRASPFRFAGIAFVFVIAALIALAGKTPYAAPAYGIVFAGGAVLLERVSLERRWLRVSMISLLIVTEVILAPCFVPILPIDKVVAYQSHIPLPLPIQTETYAVNNRLPQYFSLETGWEQMVATIADVYRGLPPEEQAKAGILTFHYGTAGAVDLLGPKYGLPKAISTAMSWHEWGPRQYDGQVLILVGFLFQPNYCERWDEGPVVVNPYMYDHVGLKGPMIHVCHGLKFDLRKQWDGLPWY
jgi:hypothetical protein